MDYLELSQFKMELPEGVIRLLDRIEGAGFEGYVVGGCVRDALHRELYRNLIQENGHRELKAAARIAAGIPERRFFLEAGGRAEPSDWDVCTSAEPSQVMELFPDCRVIPTGLKHGTVTVIMDEIPVEITTFRKESGYSDGRHPDQVVYVKELEEDLARRDFTVNAIAYAPSKGLVDPFGGVQDLYKGCLRCVGDPAKRFEEDALRMLRALRFSSCMGYMIEGKTMLAIRHRYRGLERIAQERIGSELLRFLCGNGAVRLLDSFREVFCFLIPELEPLIGYEQRSPYHNRDVWQHTLAAVGAIPPEPHLRMTMLLHDIAKPVVGLLDDYGRGRFVGHPKAGAEMARSILERMRFPGKFTERVVTLIACHDLKILPNRPDVRRWLGRLGAPVFQDLCLVRYADASGKYPEAVERIGKLNEALQSAATEILEAGDPLCRGDLAVRGDEIRKEGLAKGRAIGESLQWLLEEVMADRLVNEREALLEALRKKVSG